MNMKGVDGVVVAVAAIVATVLIGGTVGALTPVTVETTDYDYVTNINALYTMEDVPVPSEYSPAGNWNAWRASDTGTPTTGITYTELDRYNGIPVLTDPQTQTATGTIPSTLPKPVPPATAGNTSTFYFKDTDGITYVPSQVTTVADFFAWLMAQSGITPEDYIIWRLDTSNLAVAPADDFDYYKMPNQPLETLQWSGTLPAAIEWNRVNGSVGLFDGYGRLYASYLADGLILGSGGTAYNENLTNATPLGTSYDVRSDKVVDPTYIDTTKGIGLSGSRAFWSNDYDNASMRWVFRSSDDAAMRLWFTLTEPKTGYPLGVGTTMIMDASVEDGRYSVSYRVYTQNGLNLATGTIDLGVWPGVVVDIDLYNGDLHASGISVFRDFRNYTESGYTESADIGVSNAAVRRIVADNTTPTMMFGIDRTSIYLTASETVMINPQVNIPENFPALADSYQIRYDSFATWGESITINGRTYAVDDRTLRQAPYLYNGELTYIDVPLTSLRITVSNGETTLEYSTGAEYSETTTDTVVSFDGAWFFDSDLYEVTTGTATEYEFSGGFALEWDGSIVIYIIMLAAGSAVITKCRNPGLMDWAIVAFALAAGWVML